MYRLAKYAQGQHNLACDDLGVGKSPDAPGPTLHEAAQEAVAVLRRLSGLRNCVGRIDLTDSSKRSEVYDLVADAERQLARIK